MPTITFHTQAGDTHVLAAESGSVMELAVANGVAGIDGDCGGVCSCATCHVHVRPGQLSMVGEAGDLERDMLEFDDNVKPESRLSCQIPITAALDGLELTVAN